LRIQLPDVTLHWTEVNPTASPTLLLIHGWGSDHNVWDPMIQTAGRIHRFLAVDLRGHGRSSRASTPHTIGAMADDLEQMTATIGLRRMVVVGHSMGANVAVELATRRPDLVAGVCSIDPAYDDPGWANADRRIADLQARGSEAAAETLPAAFATGAAPQLIGAAARTLRATDADVLIEALRSNYLDERAFGHRAQTRKKLRRLQVPMLSLYARPESADQARGFGLTRHTIVTITGSGHFIPVEQPDTLWYELSRWLQVP
jgi:pimeloyl-ACP methyl ester carboxylesterase